MLPITQKVLLEGRAKWGSRPSPAIHDGPRKNREVMDLITKISNSNTEKETRL